MIFLEEEVLFIMIISILTTICFVLSGSIQIQEKEKIQGVEKN